MRTANRVITILLALTALGMWTMAVSPELGARLMWFYDPTVLTYAAITLSAAACFGWLLITIAERQRDNQTRCRACGYILRGISEPRCPECGERI